MTRANEARRTIVGAGVLVLVAVIGSRAVDALWIGLLAAAVLLALGLTDSSVGRGRPVVRGWAWALSAVSAALIVLAVGGLLLQRSVAMEPKWLTATLALAGWSFVISVVGFGASAFATRAVARPAALLLVVALPVGLALDRVVAGLPGGFVRDSGWMIGLTLFGVALIATGRSLRRRLA